MGITQFISPYIKQAKADLDNEKERRREAENLIAESEQQKAWLCVEDKYNPIYKVAWLKLNDIKFTKDSVEQKFSDNCFFFNCRVGECWLGCWST